MFVISNTDDKKIAGKTANFLTLNDEKHVIQHALFNYLLLTVSTSWFMVLVHKAWLFDSVVRPLTPSLFPPGARPCNIITVLDPLFAVLSQNSVHH